MPFTRPHLLDAARARKKVDHNATGLARLRDATMRFAKDIEDYVSGINQRLGKDAVLIMPVGMLR